MKRLSVTASVVVCLCVAAIVARSETQARTIYVSAVDNKGAPIADLGATDVVVTEEGQPQGPVTVEHATSPMRIAVVVDDRGLGVPEMRAGVSAFVEALRGHADVGVFSAVRPEATVVDYTADTQTLLEGIQRLLPMQTGGRGLSALTLELAQAYEKDGVARPVMVVVTIDESCNDSSLHGRLARRSVDQTADKRWPRQGAQQAEEAPPSGLDSTRPGIRLWSRCSAVA